jgi:ABC-type multidrug transport system ATPase subunit
VVILGYNGAGKTTTLRLLAHIEEPDTGSVEYGHGCKMATSRRSTTPWI